MIHIVNCALPYIFKGVSNCKLLNCNAPVSIFRRIFNRFLGNAIVPENMEQYKQLANAETVIFFADTKNFLLRCTHIEENVPVNANLNLYLWNPISYYDEPIDQVSNRWHIWTFSNEESQRFNINYAGTFYNKYLVKSAPITTDLFFVGLEKGRRPILDKIKEMAINDGLKADISIVDRLKCIYNSCYSRPMPYETVCDRIAQTRVLVDIVQEGQTGFSQRVMESLFFKKKLVTNNKFIIDAPFYSSDNIFIIGQDDLRNLSSFVNSPFLETGFDVERFDVNNWILRILKLESFDGEKH